MGKPLTQYESKSKPGKFYTIWEPNAGGEPYCDCWQWKKTRNCKHLDDYHGGKRGTIQTKEEVKSEGMSDIEHDIDNIINSFYPS